MQQKVVMRVSKDRQTVISSGRSQAAQIISKDLSGKTQIANSAPINATIGLTRNKSVLLNYYYSYFYLDERLIFLLPEVRPLLRLPAVSKEVTSAWSPWRELS